EIAISDHRSSQPDLPDMMKLASEVHLGGMIGGKAGVLHIHVGDGKKGLEPLVKILDESDLPIGMFVPTHLNRNPELFRQATEYCRSGGNIDLTAGEKAGLPVYRCIEMLISEGMDLSRVTVSSDANGSIPEGGVSKIIWLYEDIVSCIRKAKLSPGAAFSLATENVAKVLKLYPRKGCLKEGGDADILVTDKDYNIKMLFCRGRLMKKLSEKL
ncbi:MAG: amidohydrolase family protein, partial [Bacillota bacterium]|nr:amidohydrolase family protein [Bacillota bacterium]